MRLAAVAIVLLLAAGCLSPSGAEGGAAAGPAFPPLGPEAPGFDFSGVVDPDHASHAVPGLHAAGHGLDLVGHASIAQVMPLGVRGSVTAVDVWQDYAAVAGWDGSLGFAVVDLSDRSAPVTIGWAPTAGNALSARFSDDGAYVFLGCQANAGASAGTCEAPGSVRGPDRLAPGSNPEGVVVWDLADKAHPRYVTFAPTLAGGAHNLYAARIGGADYVFTASVQVLRLDRDAGALQVVAQLPGFHDVTVARHPLTGDWLLFTGSADPSVPGFAVYQVNDPANPEPVFASEGNEGWVGWHDQVLVPGLVDGRAILLVAGESMASAGGEGLPDLVSVVDVTDPGAPVLLSQWQPPFASQLPWTGLWMFSAHEMAATPTGQVAVAWYHGGVWVIDVSTRERQAGPVILAAYQPHEANDVVVNTLPLTPLPYVPFVWGAAWTADGHLVVPDMHTGVYVLRPAWGLHPAVDSGQ